MLFIVGEPLRRCSVASLVLRTAMQLWILCSSGSAKIEVSDFRALVGRFICPGVQKGAFKVPPPSWLSLVAYSEALSQF